MNCIIHSINDGKGKIPQEILYEFEYVVNLCKLKVRPLAASRINKFIAEELHSLGWSGEVKIDVSSNITITSMRQKIGLCIQTGNYSRVYADILKLQTLYLRGSIVAGAIIVPSKEAALILATNISNGSRLRKELKIFSSIITLPIVIIEFEEV